MPWRPPRGGAGPDGWEAPERGDLFIDTGPGYDTCGLGVERTFILLWMKFSMDWAKSGLAPAARLMRLPVIAAACLAVIGVPVNTPEKLAALIGVALLLFSSTSREGAWRYALAAAVVLGALTLKGVVPHTQVEAGHNLYLPTADADARYHELPMQFRAALDVAFLRANPRATWCDSREELRRRGTPVNRPLRTGETVYLYEHCWRNAVLRPETFAFTGDGFFRAQPQLRILDRLAIDGLDDARIAALYAFDTAWYFWRENTNRIAPAWYLALTLPAQLVGSRICTRGYVYWSQDATWSAPQGGEACREVEPRHVGSRLWAFDVGAAPRLAVQLERSARLLAWDLVLRVLLVGALATLVWLTLRVEPRRFARAGLWFLAGAGVVALAAPGFFTQALTIATERDALIYRGLGYNIARALAEGRWLEALRGGEDVFLFMPGYRYFRALELILFGDTSYATLVVLLATPPLLWQLARLVLRGRGWLVAYLVLSLAILARLFDWAMKGYSEAAGFFLMIAGVVLFLRTLSQPARYGPAQAAGLWAAFLLVALATWIRPNFALVIGVMGLAYLRVHAAGFGWRMSLAILSASLVVFAVTLHNVYFGGRLVWLTVPLRGDSLRVEPVDYAAMLAEWSRGVFGEKSHAIAHHLGWVLPRRWLGLAAAGYVLARGGPGWSAARVLAGISLALYMPFLFYFAPSRHLQAANAMAILCVLVALQMGVQSWRARRAGTAT